uniref:Uncharacterized protein n=1 Tax=Anguilla anguilla TaxID=7936 RepID=A0A0E9TRC7_ANGAN
MIISHNIQVKFKCKDAMLFKSPNQKVF